jgi:hypothetical protein
MLRGIKMGKDVRLPEPQPYDGTIYQQQPYTQPGYYYPPPKRKKKFTAVKAIAATGAIVVPVVTVVLLYSMVVGLAPSCACVPNGIFGDVEVLDSTSVIVEFGKVGGEPRPMDLQIELALDRWHEWSYSFEHNGDGELIPQNGNAVASITYADLADNQKVNVGDRLSITGLEPDTEYTINLIWASTGDLITSTTFSTL